MEPIATIEHRETRERPLHTTLTRGANGVYRWEISYYASDVETCMSTLVEVNRMLTIRFGGAVEEGDDG